MMSVEDIYKRLDGEIIINLLGKKPKDVYERLDKMHNFITESMKKNKWDDAYKMCKRWIMCIEWLKNQKVIDKDAQQKYYSVKKQNDIKRLFRGIKSRIEGDFMIVTQSEKNRNTNNGSSQLNDKLDLESQLPVVPTEEPHPKNLEIGCTEFYNIMHNKESRDKGVLIIDVRDAEDFAARKMAFQDCVINIPESKIFPKKTADYYQLVLIDDHVAAQLFQKRGDAHIIVLVDCDCQPNNLDYPIAIFKKFLEEDKATCNNRLAILLGGFEEWMRNYPKLVVQSESKRLEVMNMDHRKEITNDIENNFGFDCPFSPNPQNASTPLPVAATKNAIRENADLSKNPVANYPWIGCNDSSALTRQTVDITKVPREIKLLMKQYDHPAQFQLQLTRESRNSHTNREPPHATDKCSSGRRVYRDHNYAREGSKAAEKEKRFSGAVKKNDAVLSEKIQRDSINPVKKGNKSHPTVVPEALIDVPNTGIPGVNTSSLQSNAQAAKRRMKDGTEVLSKRSKSNTDTAKKENQQLDGTGIVTDNATWKINLSSSFNLNSAVPAVHNTPLHDAVNAKNLAEVKTLLEKGASILACNAYGNTPLHLAFVLRNKAIMDVLLSAIEATSSNENVKNNVGLSILHIACHRDNGGVVKNLLKSSADLKDSVSDESSPWNGYTALHFAAQSKSVEVMKILVKASSKPDLAKKNGNGETPVQIINQQMQDLLFMSDLLSFDYEYNSYDNFSNFHVACTRDDPSIVKSFLEKGAPIDAPINRTTNICPRYYPIHFAVERKSFENVKILVENGADLTRTNNKNMTPLHLAMYTEKNGERTELVDLLYRATRNKEANPKDKSDLSYFHVACTRNDMALVKQLLDENEDVNLRVNYRDRRFYNYTPLHFATLYGNAELARLLIERGADVNACDDAHSGTPLHIAFDFGYEELIEILLSSGANPKAVSPLDKQTMLHYLVGGYVKVHENNEEAMLPYVEKLIVDFGVDVNAKDHEGDTALHIACEQFSASAPVAKLLLEFGADISLENHKGETPFVWALTKMNNWLRDDPDQLAMLYSHVKKLRTLGLEVNEMNERCCNLLLKKRKAWKIENLGDDHLVVLEQERRMEIEKMMKVELGSELSLYDFAKLKPGRYNDVAGLDFNLIKSVIHEIPNYRYLVKLKLREINVQNPQALVDQ